MRMYNASLEKFKHQCNSFVFVFKPKEFTQVPYELVNFLYEQVKYKGVFIVPDDVTEGSPEFDKRKREALLSYLGVTLKDRIQNYASEADDYRRKGVTMEKATAWKRAERWYNELHQMLESQSPIEEELSFLEGKRTENTVISQPKEESFVEAKEAPKKRMGRPKKVQPEVTA